MPKEIWNLGRVVGESAYETYVKQHISEDPDTPPATEREWLASSLAGGSSMILKVPNTAPHVGDTDHTLLQVQLPADSKLAAANTIIAQFFDASIDQSAISGDWVTRVTDYGPLIANYSGEGHSPSGDISSADILDTSKVPTDTLQDWGPVRKSQLVDYLKIVDGVVLQPGNWYSPDQSLQPPRRDFSADIGGGTRATIRLHVRGKISTNPLVLLTGFTIKSVLSGISGTDTALDTNSPSDGDFLGPAVFPWAARIMFTVPSAYAAYVESTAYSRTIEEPTSAGSVEQRTITENPVIDMRGSNPSTFYTRFRNRQDVRSIYGPDLTSYPDAAYPYEVMSYDNNSRCQGDAVLAVYQRDATYPPALYGNRVDSTGQTYINPIDNVAPGSVKMLWDSPGKLETYESEFVGTNALSRRPDGTLKILTRQVSSSGYLLNTEVKDVANVKRYFMYNNTSSGAVIEEATDVPARMFMAPGNNPSGTAPSGETLVPYVDKLSGTDRPIVATIFAGDRSMPTISLDTKVQSSFDQGSGTYNLGLTVSLNPSNNPIELTRYNSDYNLTWSALLNALRKNLPINVLGNRLKSARDSLIRAHGGSSSDGPYLEFGPDNAKLRLYISNVAPNIADVPEGSIGIGWGFSSPQS